ncbi:MAG: M20/M25/M40 family metallo-hydrolase [Oscillospiraceae bacterium]
MTVLIIIISLLAAFVAVLLYNMFKLSVSARKLSPEKKIYSDDEEMAFAKRCAEMIRCKTVSSKNEYADTEFALLRGVVEKMFPNVCKMAEKHIFSDDCYIYKINGKDSSRNIMIMSHHDVVAASGEWQHEPFGGEIYEGKLWGRGTVDTKTPLYAEFEAMEALLKDGFVPECNVYIGSSHNEEIAGDGIPTALAYFKENNINFEMILDEGGAILDAPVGGMKCKCAMIAVHEKGRHSLVCTAKCDKGHAGLAPKTDTPVVRMSRFITEISRKNIFIKRIYPEVKAMFEAMSPYMTFPLRIVFSNLWCFSPLLTFLMPRLNPQAGAMVGTMCTFNEIHGGKRGLFQSDDCTATAFLRCVNDNDLHSDIETFKGIADKYNIIVSNGEGCEYHHPADMSLPPFAFIRQCVGDVFPHIASAPFVLPAGTDARHLTEICPCVIRFAPIDLDKQQFASVHSENENIDVHTIANAVEFYKTVVRNYK